MKPVEFDFSKLMDDAPDCSAYWAELLDIAFGEMLIRMEGDLKHFNAEIKEHERMSRHGKYNKDKWHHSGQVGAYRHVVKHVGAWVAAMKRDIEHLKELTAKYEGKAES